MAPVPKKKHTRSRSGKRRAHIKLSLPTLVKCNNCGKLKFPHKVCPHCGKYSK
ncbi:MAG: 50S ribosomal protein L32 [Candidatus Woesebacteria bacterium]|nr:MAG: 50S ribosomal protein L32 [Candidatus Woesebacteria bacterium]